MNLSVAISLFFLVAVAYILIIDIFTMLFRMTGLTEEKARFQVISLLTNSGFTTRESELVLSTIIRRRLARKIMLFGYIFSVTIVTVFVNMVLSLPKAMLSDIWIIIPVLLIVFAVFLVAKRVPRVKEKFNELIEKIGRKWVFKDQINPVIVIDEFAKGVMAEVQINVIPKSLENIELKDTGMSNKFGLHLIFIKRGADIVDDIRHDTILKKDDRVIIFGDLINIREFFKLEEERTIKNTLSDKESDENTISK